MPSRMMKLRNRDTHLSPHHSHRVGVGVVSLLVMLLMFSSCYNKTDLTRDDDNDIRTVQVQFTIAVGNTTTGSAAKRNTGVTTRATTGTDWTQYSPAEDGVGVENNIDVTKLHVILYNTNSDGQITQLAGVVQDLRITSSTDNNSGYLYNVYGSMTIPTDRLINDETFQGRVVIFANTDAPTGGWSSISTVDLSSISYTYEKDNSHGDPATLPLQYIPMWGISPTQSITLQGGSYNNLGTIDLLRAMAKVKVTLRNDMIEKGYSFTNITLNRYNTSGNVMPSGVAQLASAEGTRNLTYQESFSLPTGVTQEQNLSFLANTGDTESQTLYIPEYDNLSDGVTPATIAVTMQNSNGATISGTLEFKDYSDGRATSSAYNIVRNHYYTFEVYSETGVNLKVVPWVPFSHNVHTW